MPTNMDAAEEGAEETNTGAPSSAHSPIAPRPTTDTGSPSPTSLTPNTSSEKSIDANGMKSDSESPPLAEILHSPEPSKGVNGMKSDSESPPSAEILHSPELSKGVNGSTQDHDIVDNDSDSELSDLGATPPPPTSELRYLGMQHGHCDVECRHATWCQCPMHACYPQKASPHLSEWALAAHKGPTSSLRSTAGKGENYGNIGRREALLRTSSDCVEYLKAMSVSVTDNAEAAANDIVNLITKCSDKAFDGPDVIARLEKLEGALAHWGETSDYVVLREEFAAAVDANSDIMLLFQTFLPSRLRKSREALWEEKRKAMVPPSAVQLDGRPFGWAGGRFP